MYQGKNLHTADVLSWTSTNTSKETTSQQEIELFANTVVSSLPTSSNSLSSYSAAQANDTTCSQILEYCRNGWPTKQHINSTLRPYWEARNNITVVNNLLLCGQHIIVPTSLWEETINKIHCGHLGIQTCLLRAKTSVWWPGLTQQVRAAISNCVECVEHSTPTVVGSH